MKKIKKLMFSTMLLGPVVLGHNLFAVEIEEAVTTTIKMNNTLPSGVIDVSCIQCEATTQRPLEDELFCSNLYTSVCLNANGSSSSENSYNDEQKKLKDKFLESRHLAVKALGFSHYNEAVTEKLKEIGFELPENLTDANIRYLKNDYGNGETTSVAFPAKVACEKVGEQPTSIMSLKPSGLLNLNSPEYKNQKKLSMLTRAKLDYAYLDIPSFLQEEYSRCSDLKKSPEEYLPSENIELAQKCAKFPLIRERALDLYRMEDSAEYKEEAMKFISENILPEASKALTEEEKKDPENSRMNRLNNAGSLACNEINSLYLKLARKKIESFDRILNKSKPVVDNMIAAYYDDETKKSMDELFVITKKEVKDLLPKITTDAKKLKTISKGYDEMKLAWLKSPELSRYEKDKSGLLVLKDSEEGDEDEIDQAFGNSKLTYFTEINAFYTSLVMEGDSVGQIDTVHMMPYFLSTIKSNKYNFLAVLAHEAGHKIGPAVSKSNGHDLRAE